MTLLLDTHIFLWYVTNNPLLSARHVAAINDPANVVYLSVASVWESVIKYQLGKLPLPAPAHIYLPQQRDANGIAPLLIDDGAMPHLAGLPPLHRDPFDRIIVSQALQYGLAVVTADAQVTQYPVACLPG